MLFEFTTLCLLYEAWVAKRHVESEWGRRNKKVGLETVSTFMQWTHASRFAAEMPLLML